MREKKYESINQFKGKLKPYFKSSSGARKIPEPKPQVDDTPKSKSYDFVHLLFPVLILLIAILLADKFNIFAWSK
jgi:hypothetical protein